MKFRVALVIIMLSMPGLFGCSAGVVKIDAANIAKVILTNIEAGESEFVGAEIFSRFANAYNSSARYRNNVGTTLPFRADIGFVDGSSLIIWGGVGDFFSVRMNEQELNIKSDQLENWFNELMVKNR